MKYLINLNKQKSRAHLWYDGDTYCKMYSTGGMRKKKYAVHDSTNNREICLMCQNVWNEIHQYKDQNG